MQRGQGGADAKSQARPVKSRKASGEGDVNGLSPCKACNRQAKISEVDEGFQIPMKVPWKQQVGTAGVKHG